MPQPILIPGYDRSAWFADDYPQSLVTPEKVVLHSTEGGTLPSYSGGASAPQVTLDPWRRRRYQHFPLNMPARALLNPASTPVSENRDGAVQIEIIGYSDGNYAVKHGNAEYDLDRLTDDDYDWLGQEIADICEATGIRPVLTEKPWIEYPASWGLHTPARMSSAEYDSFRGICAHKHVSGNDHGDADLDPDRLQSSIDRHSGNADPKIAAEQAALNAALADWPGYVPLTIDGIDGPRTALARSQFMATLDSLAKQLDRIEKSLTVPLNDEGQRVMGTERDSLTVGQVLGGTALASRRAEVVLAVAEPEATEAMRKWASDGGPKPGIRKDGE